MNYFFIFWNLMYWPIFIKNKIAKMFNSFCVGTSYLWVKKKTAKNVYLGVTGYVSWTFLFVWIFDSFFYMIHIYSICLEPSAWTDSCIPPFLYPSSPEFLQSWIPPFMYPSSLESFLSYSLLYLVPFFLDPFFPS